MRPLNLTVRVLAMMAIMLAVSCGPKSGAPARSTGDGDTRKPESPGVAAPTRTETQPMSTSDGGPRIVDFQPGIRIDYRVPQVEVEAEVIQRSAELELFAYAKSPTPKEHETVLLLRVRPQHVYLALGLIGLTAGQPASYNWETEKITPASGDPVDVLVRVERNGTLVEESACDWMTDLSAGGPMKRTHWLFTGSRPDAAGRFAADIEGTVVTVVSFDTALLALPEFHSDADATLWLKARSEIIPPVGTNVTLILRPVKVPSSPTE